MMRTVAMAAVLLLPEAAAADEIRHTSFAGFMVGTYAASQDRCGTNDTSNITISETKFTLSDDTCDVRWIVETVGRSGAFFSAHGACVSASKSAEAKVIDVIIQPESGDRLSIGTSFDSLKIYQRCRAK